MKNIKYALLLLFFIGVNFCSSKGVCCNEYCMFPDCPKGLITKAADIPKSLELALPLTDIEDLTKVQNLNNKCSTNLSFRKCVPQSFVKAEEAGISVKTPNSEKGYMIISQPIQLDKKEELYLTFEVELLQGGFGVGLDTQNYDRFYFFNFYIRNKRPLSGDDSLSYKQLVSYKSYHTSGLIKDTIRLPSGKDKTSVQLVFTNDLPTAGVSRFIVRRYAITEANPSFPEHSTPPVPLVTPLPVEEKKASVETFPQAEPFKASVLATPIHPQSPLEQEGYNQHQDLNKASILTSDQSNDIIIKSAASAQKLKEELAQQQQAHEVGVIIAQGGAQGAKKFKRANEYVNKYGGTEEEWVKKSSSSFEKSDGSLIETHWVENLKTGKKYDFKPKEIFPNKAKAKQ